MKWHFLSTAAVCSLMVASAAWASPDVSSAGKRFVTVVAQNDADHRDDRRTEEHRRTQSQDQQGPRPTHTQLPPRQLQAPNPPQQPQAPMRQYQGPKQPQQYQRPQITRSPQIVPNQSRQQQRFDWRHYSPGQRPPLWDHYRHFDRQSWEGNISSEHRYRWHSYHRPNGWYYRRWVFGLTLPSFFWTRDYWIDDYWMFRLPDPPYGYVWVRYGNDALLVNVETGFILRVVYDVFY